MKSTLLFVIALSVVLAYTFPVVTHRLQTKLTLRNQQSLPSIAIEILEPKEGGPVWTVITKSPARDLKKKK